MLMLFLTVAMVHIVALMSPGPDFFFVSQTAVSRSRKEAMMGVLGITCGVMVWAGIALLGLHLIIEKMARLHTLIMVGGGLYLCWMGYQMLRSALKKRGRFCACATGRTGKKRAQFPERLTDQSRQSESNYLLWFGILAVCRR